MIIKKLIMHNFGVYSSTNVLEFASNKPEEWLKALIKDAIETNGSIEELRINEIFDNLLNFLY